MTEFYKKAQELVGQMTIGEKTSLLLSESPKIERLNISEYNWWNEGLHGYARSGVATVFPQAIGLAATFNKKLVKKVATAISDEARAKYNAYQKAGYNKIYQGLTIWSPNINIFRDPRWGRGHETYGEDPFLTAEIGKSFVSGLQGDRNYKYRKCDATLKHYAAHSGPELNRESFNSVVSLKDLYETYLYAFKECIKACEPSGVMASYNAINGVPVSCNNKMLGDVLRGEFGFEGYVVSDCGAVCNIYEHHKYVATKAEAAAKSVQAGCDLNCGNAYSSLQVALLSGLLSEDDISLSATRLVAARLRLGMNSADNKYDNISFDVVDSEKHRKLARKAARDGIVMLKNNGVLPLKNSDKKSIAVIGCNANNGEILLANYNGLPSSVSTVADGITKRNLGLTRFALGSHHTKTDVFSTFADAYTLAVNSDIIVYCMGLAPYMEGENGDDYNGVFAGDKASLQLPEVQRQLFCELKKANKPIITVNISGSCVLLSDVCNQSDALFQAFYPGEETGNAFADILFGKSSPCGKLPVTFYKDESDLPPLSDYSMVNRTYRYYKGEPLFEFGFGLSYTQFEYSEITVAGAKLKFKIKNTGKFGGVETYKVFVKSNEQNQPISSLKEFGKVNLKPNQSKTVTLALSKQMFELYDNDGKTFVSDKGYTVLVDDKFIAIDLKTMALQII